MIFPFKPLLLSLPAVHEVTALDQVSELDQNVNRAGFKRRNRPLRLASEFGLGLLGEAVVMGIMAVIPDHIGNQLGMLLLLGCLIGIPAWSVLGVYFGGKFSGGRGHLG